uniref:Diphthamide biosynthesis protein 3 n=1 Tax=Monodelphis domestica TaxID=13616 RepID=A0A5F8G3V8_MONDO
MSVFHDEVEIEDFEYEEETETYFYPCPCGDNFIITKDQFMCGETVSVPPTSKELVKC